MLQFLLVVKFFFFSLKPGLSHVWVAGRTGIEDSSGGDGLEIQQDLGAKGKGHTWGH